MAMVLALLHVVGYALLVLISTTTIAVTTATGLDPVVRPLRICRSNAAADRRHDDERDINEDDRDPCWIHLTHLPSRPDDDDHHQKQRGVAHLARTNMGADGGWLVGVANKPPQQQQQHLHDENDDYAGGWPLATTSEQARHLQRRQQPEERRVLMCVNGGPFDRDGWSSGPLVVDGAITRTKSTMETDLVGMGVVEVVTTTTNTNTTVSTRWKWVMGKYPQVMRKSLNRHRRRDNDDVNETKTTKATTSKLLQFVSGFDWLVYNESSVVIEDRPSNTAVTTEPAAWRAPRTAIGLDAENNFMMLVVDGCEQCWQKRGPTLVELAELLIEQGAKYAINMDGGGSSTMILHSNSSINSIQDDHFYLVNRPTCLDVVPLICERPVVSIICAASRSSSLTPLNGHGADILFGGNHSTAQ